MGQSRTKSLSIFCMSKIPKNLMIYIHYPYCSVICNYCNFTKFPLPDKKPDFYKPALLKELDFEIKELREARNLTSIYFGGGTPSLAEPKMIGDIISTIMHNFPSSEPEITLEVNPGKITREKLREFKMVGVNRLSLGIQALNDGDLKFFGRDHRKRDALELVEFAHSIFNNISMDFIWARPGQSVKDWSLELEEILGLQAKHLSLYQLTLEKGTKLFRQVSENKIVLPGDDECADLYQITRELAGKEYKQYEVSSFCKEGYHSRHNVGYWKGYDYIGVGPGAHGRKSVNNQHFRTRRLASPSRWSRQIETLENGRQSIELIPNIEFQKEILVFGLRMIQGIDGKEYKEITGENLENVVDLNELEMMERLGLVNAERKDAHISNLTLSFHGLAVSDSILCKILK